METPELPAGVDQRENEFGIHDNFTETAPIKSLTPDLVKEDLAKACFPNYPEIGIGLIGKGYAQ